MKIKKYSDEEKLQIISESKSSGNITATAKRYSISDGTIHGWIKKFAGKNSLAKSENDLNQEIKRLKKILADRDLENAILKDLVKKTVQVWTSEEQSQLNTSPNDFLRRR